MGDKYLFGMSGVAENVIYPGKAILTFTLNNAEQRVLLWIKSFVHEKKHMSAEDSFAGKLSAGDKVIFDCHTYDRESRDKCQWYAALARKEEASDVEVKSTQVMNQTGRVSELDPGKGVILFDFHDQEQRVFFMRSKYYHFEKRPGNKHKLTDFLSENDAVQFDAQQCDPAKSNKNSSWFCSLVWKGKRPKVTTTTIGGGRSTMDDMGSEDKVSSILNEMEVSNLSLPPGLSERQGYKVFEANSSMKEGKGSVVNVLNEECGIALWLVQQNTLETIFFHRKNSFLGDLNLSKFDIQESFSPGSMIDIIAVPAVEDFPCKWIARKATSVLS